MAGVVESFKKIYENKKSHILIGIIVFFWALLSSLFDIKFGSLNSHRQNPFDALFGLIVGAFSLQFLHSVINGSELVSLPSFKDVKGKVYWHMVCLNIVWGLYAALFIISAVMSYMVFHSWLLPSVLILSLLIVSPFVYYIYIAYAQNLSLKGLFNPMLIIKFLNLSFKETYLKFLLFILISFAFAIGFILLYVILMLLGVAKLVPLAPEFYLLDIVLYPLIGYLLVVTWYFVFPYSLVDVYNEKIRPLFEEEKYYG